MPDYNREIEKVETRLQIQIDRRFNDVDIRLHELKEQLYKLNETIEKTDDRKYDENTWNRRQVITVIISFFLGGGISGLIQIISTIALKR